MLKSGSFLKGSDFFVDNFNVKTHDFIKNPF